MVRLLRKSVKGFILNTMKEIVPSKPAKRPGRPLSFDRDKVLEMAMLRFWRTGFETTSVADLTEAMGVTAPSLYAAFGNKENLFLECLRRYATPGPKRTSELICEAPSAREAAHELLQTSALWFTQPGSPAGCMIASAASSGSDASRQVRAALKKVRKEIETALQRRIEVDIRSGKLPTSADAHALATMTVALIQGMSTLARDGASRTDLLALVRAAMPAWSSI